MNERGKSALGYGQITDVSAAVAVSTAFSGGFPAGTESVWVQAETQNVRYRDDNVAPTASVGMIFVAGSIYQLSVAQASQMKVIQTAASAKLNVSAYGARV